MTSFSPSPSSSGTLATSLATAPSNVVSKARMMSTRRVELKSASRFRASKMLRCCAMTPIVRNSSSSSFGYDDGEKADKKAMRKRKSSIVITRAIPPTLVPEDERKIEDENKSFFIPNDGSNSAISPVWL